jgi:hypothetical protein
MLNLRQLKFVLLFPLASLMTVGCGGGAADGPKMYTVNGTVAFTGQPLKEADLLIRSVDGKHSAGAKVTDGKFVLKAPVGPSIVEITALREVPGQFSEDNPGEKVAVKEQFLPAKYNKESTLTLEIKPDTKDVKFDLMP